ncbi:uncharacterized protein L201_002901 [Kwoniella dendrophila CBS 6074]|uniref:AB hydrolase-1 domain-containing protein n=1 Tax=Kwoniella dendrophila CBS 6074 TaxID=1295534 RepID=A0AAX4JT96_9TREE
MPRIIIPDKPFDIYYRLSTPSKRERAIEIDEKYETILFFHPYWLDSFYFYPQFDDPALYENYNLICFDAPAHGSTKVKKISSDPVTWLFFCSLIKDALITLNIHSVHLVGSTMGCCPAMHFASSYPEMTKTLLMSAPPAPVEATNWSLTFRECMHILINAVKIRDPEPLDAITSVIFDYNATSHSGKVIKSIEEEYIQLTRSRLLSGELNSDKTLPIVISLALSRKQLLSHEEFLKILNDHKIPILIIQGTNEGWESEEVDDQWLKQMQDIHQLNIDKSGGKSLDNLKRIILNDVTRWMTLTSSDILNPIITKFVSEKTISKSLYEELNLEIDESKSTEMNIITITKNNHIRKSSLNNVRKPSFSRDIGVFDDKLFNSLSLNENGKDGNCASQQTHPSITKSPQIRTIPNNEAVKIQVEVITKVE